MRNLEDDFPLLHSVVIDLLSYDKDTGIFMWKKKRRGIRTDISLGTCNGKGYLRITVLGQSYYAHRLAWFYIYGHWPENEIDHINAIRSDNRICNLRKATTQENNLYKFTAQKNNKAGILGVSWHKKANKWQAHFQKKYLGLFSTIDEASAAYKSAKGQS